MPLGLRDNFTACKLRDNGRINDFVAIERRLIIGRAGVEKGNIARTSSQRDSLGRTWRTKEPRRGRQSNELTKWN